MPKSWKNTYTPVSSTTGLGDAALLRLSAGGVARPSSFVSQRILPASLMASVKRSFSRKAVR
jgi:hypothetical protein